MDQDAQHHRLLAYAATLPRPKKNADLYGLNGLYLRRWIVLEFPKEKAQLRLHQIVRSDEDEELHDHPWGDPSGNEDHPGRTSRALILFGGYEEERRILLRRKVSSSYRRVEDWRIDRKRYLPGDINVLHSDDFHRIDRLLHPLGSWSLFWTGPKTKSWQFWNRNTGIYTPWYTFIENKERCAKEAT